MASYEFDRDNYHINGSTDEKNPTYDLCDALHTMRNDIYSTYSTVDSFRGYVNEEAQKRVANKTLKGSEVQKYTKRRVEKFKKHRAALNVALNAAIENAETIKSIDKMFNVLNQIISIEKYVEDNKRAKKIISDAKTLKLQLGTIRSSCERKLLKNIEKLRTLRVKVNYTNSKPSEMENFVHEVLRDATMVLPMSKDIVNIKEDIENKNEEIEKSYENQQKYVDDDINKLFDKLKSVEEQLIGLEDKDLKKEIKEETKAIRRVVKPKTMSLSKENLEKMKKSELVSEDMELVQECIQYKFIGKAKGFLADIARKKLEEIKSEISSVIKEEYDKRTKLRAEQREIDRKVDYSNQAANAYEMSIFGSKRKQNASKEADIKNDILITEISDLDMQLGDLKKEHGKEYVAYTEVIGGEPRDRKAKLDYSEEMKSIREELSDKYKQVEQNKQEAENIKKQKISIPEKYKNMKEKLQSDSKLREAVTRSYEMGGINL